MGELIKLNKNDISYFNRQGEAIQRNNLKLQILRKKQLTEVLHTSTEVRIEILKKIRDWLGILEKKLFDPAIVDKMSLNKVIVLFKIVSQYSIRMLSQVNDLEKILKSYMEMNVNFETQMNKNLGTENDSIKLKKDLMQMFTKSLIKTADDAIVVQEKDQQIIVLDDPELNKKVENDVEPLELDDVNFDDDLKDEPIKDEL